jgi:NADH-quinone oxidoreductase subunit M
LATALALLKLTSKSERIGEAISEMFMWTLFGSFFLLMGFFCLYSDLHIYAFNYSQYQSNGIICLLFVIGFGVKIPLWPFFSWLLKAHVEASVEFSILLSGFIVKLGILGLWRILDVCGCDWIYFLLVGLSCLAILDATLRLFVQNDLKKIVALTTIIEMNWLNLCYVLGDSNLVYLANYLIVVHCFTTSSEFLLVEYLSKRYHTRDFWQISGLWYKAPNLWYASFLIVFTTIGFPGTSIFFAKFMFLSVIISYSYGLFLFFMIIFFILLPLFFIRLWVPIWFGLNRNTGITFDLSSRELLLIGLCSLFNILFGLVPLLFFSLF